MKWIEKTLKEVGLDFYCDRKAWAKDGRKPIVMNFMYYKVHLDGLWSLHLESVIGYGKISEISSAGFQLRAPSFLEMHWIYVCSASK